MVLAEKYFVYGDDSVARKATLESLMDPFIKKGYQKIVFDDVSFNEQDFLVSISSDDLFGTSRVIVLDGGLSDATIRAFLEKHGEFLKSAQNPIFFTEGSFLKKDFPSFAKLFTGVHECKKKTVESKKFNVFPLVDAIVQKNKKEAWLLFQDAMSEEVTVEEIYNLLFWQYKIVLLTLSGKSAGELGLAPFVFTKAKKYSQLYTQKDVRQKLFSTILMFQDSRFNKEGEMRLEQFILSLS